MLFVGRCDVWSLLPGIVNSSLPNTSAAPVDRAEKQLGTRGRCWKRDWRLQHRAAKKLPALLEDSSSVPPGTRVCRHGKHAHHGMHDSTPLLYCE